MVPRASETMEAMDVALIREWTSLASGFIDARRDSPACAFTAQEKNKIEGIGKSLQDFGPVTISNAVGRDLDT